MGTEVDSAEAVKLVMEAYAQKRLMAKEFVFHPMVFEVLHKKRVE